jgi:sRNA-binding carbon storage regulator CsrA
VLSICRKRGERVRILTSDGPIWILVGDRTRNGEAQLCIDAPRWCRIEREEIIQREEASK